MIAANEGVTRWMMDREWPFVYRIHEEPALASLQKFEKLAATVGIKVMLSKGEVSPKLLADVVKKVEGHPAQDLLNMALLRSLKQAIYSATHGIHYGLASEAYTHFTSPIRRYPDLVVHRLIRWALQVQKGQKKTLKKHERDELEEELAGVAEHCSYRERVAANADREAIRLKQVRFMTKHLGEDFDAKVIGMSEAGLFVMIPDPYVEGMVPREAMLDDFYEYNEDRMIFFGRRSRKTYKVGDRFRVRVVRADLDRRQIDFSLSEHAEAALVERNPWSRGPRPVANPIQRPAQSDEQTDLPQWENAKSPRKFSKESQGGRHDGQKSPRRRRR
jgi:ribonuclease R